MLAARRADQNRVTRGGLRRLTLRRMASRGWDRFAHSRRPATGGRQARNPDGLRRWPSESRPVTGDLFKNRRGRIFFAPASVARCDSKLLVNDTGRRFVPRPEPATRTVACGITSRHSATSASSLKIQIPPTSIADSREESDPRVLAQPSAGSLPRIDSKQLGSGVYSNWSQLGPAPIPLCDGARKPHAANSGPR